MSTPLTCDSSTITLDTTATSWDSTYCYYTSVSVENIPIGSVVTFKVEVDTPSLVTVTYGSQIPLYMEMVTSSLVVEFVTDQSPVNLTAIYECGVSGAITYYVGYNNYHTLYNNSEGVMKFKDGFNGWTSFMSFTPDNMIKLNNWLYSFKKGKLHKHDGNKAEFYGVENDSVISFRASTAKGVIKTLKYLVLESDVKPKFINIQAVNPYLQQTNLVADDLEYKEGNLVASVLFDEMSPNISGATQLEQWEKALFTGDKIRAKYFDIFFIFDNVEQFNLKAVTVGTDVSTGHKN